MLLLTSTSDKIRLTTAAALTIDVQADWIDYSGGAVTPGRTNSAITTATTTDIVAAPASSTQRSVKSIFARNKDASPQSLIFIHTDGSTPVQLFICTLNSGESVTYTDKAGFILYDSSGRRKDRSVLNAPQLPGAFLSPIFSTGNITSTKTITSASTFALYMGKAPRALASVQLRARVTTAMATITWGEVALAIGAPVLNGNPTLKAVGFADVSAVFNATGVFTVNINVSSGQAVNEADDLWLLVGNAATTACILRAQSIADDLQSGFQASATFRPSTNIGTPTAFTLESSASLAAWLTMFM